MQRFNTDSVILANRRLNPLLCSYYHSGSVHYSKHCVIKFDYDKQTYLVDPTFKQFLCLFLKNSQKLKGNALDVINQRFPSNFLIIPLDENADNYIDAIVTKFDDLISEFNLEYVNEPSYYDEPVYNYSCWITKVFQFNIDRLKEAFKEISIPNLSGYSVLENDLLTKATL